MAVAVFLCWRCYQARIRWQGSSTALTKESFCGKGFEGMAERQFVYNRSDMMHDQKGVVYECIEADIRPGDNWPS